MNDRDEQKLAIDDVRPEAVPEDFVSIENADDENERFRRDPKDYWAKLFEIHLRRESYLLDLQQRFTRKVFWVVLGWLVGIAVLACFQGFGFWNFSLDPVAFSAIVGGTSVAVIGLFAAVVRWIFLPRPLPKGGDDALGRPAGLALDAGPKP